MYKNQLQELAQRSCFNLPAYSCIREGPDHAPRFKATVNFNGEVFESPNYCSTLRQAEHAAAEVALNTLSKRGPSQSLAARILDETGVYKNLLQEIAQRAGAPLPVYTTVRSGLGHLPVFTCTVELAGIKFRGEPAKNKKQAEKNAAMAACSSLRQFAHQSGFSSQTSREGECNEEQEQITIARALANHRQKELAILKQQSVAKKRLLAQRDNPSCYSIRESSSHSIRESSGHSIRESSSHSIEHQHFGGVGAQWVSSDLSSEGCSRFNSNHNQHLQQKLHLPASAASGSKILPFIRSILPQRNRSGSLPDSALGSSISSETITTNRDASAACVCNTNTLTETLPLVLAREAIATNRSDASTRRVHRPTPHQVSILFEEHERDEEEWLRGDLPRDNNSPTLGISNLAEWVSAFASTNSLTWQGQSSWNMQRHQQQHHQQLMSQNITQRPVSSFGGSRCLVSSPSPSMVAPPVRIRTSIPVCSAPPPRRSTSEFLGSDFLSHDTNLIHSPMHTAPAVRIRSVAPVCSAPSRQRTLPQDLNRNSLQEEDSTLELLNQLRL